MHSELLSTLGLCKRAGMLVVGDEPVEAVARARDARVIFLAADAAENTVRRAAHFAEVGQCLWLRLPFSKEPLGRAVGRTSCALVAVTDIGFAASIVRRLAQSDPAAYSEAAERLELKARRAAERKEELAAHEKNLRQGKQPPASPEPKNLTRKPAPRGGETGAPRPAPGRAAKQPAPRTGRPAPKDRSYPDRKPADRPFHKESDSSFREGPKQSSQRGARPPYGKPAQGAGSRPPHSGRPPSGPRQGAASHPPHSGRPPAGPRQGGHPRSNAKPANPYLHSRPVKRGKGSFRKKDS